MRSDIAVRVVAPDGLIADRYRLLNPLGAGASATVWAAVDETLGRRVALKLLSGSAAFDEIEREQLRSEARALAALAHPRVIVVFDYLETPGLSAAVQPVLVTELLDGRNLADCLEAGPLPWPVALGVCGQLAEALAAAHAAGIVHRDVTPANVMLTESGVKLLDFGIAQGPTDRDDPDGIAVGTPVCMAPEQLAGHAALPASDMYAFGCVLHWCLTGAPPYLHKEMAALSYAHAHATPPALRIPELPPDVAELYLSCLAKDPAGRPTAAGAAQLLAPFARGTGTELVVAESPVVRLATDTLRPAVSHAGRRRPMDRRVLPAVFSLVALAAVFALIFGTAHATMDGKATASRGSGAPAATPSTMPSPGASDMTVSPAPTMANVMMPSLSAPASAGMSQLAFPSASAPTMSTFVQIAFPAPGADPIGYLQALIAQIQSFVSQGPNTLEANAGQQLTNSIGNLENAITAAQQGRGKKQWHAVATGIAALQQQISNDAAAGQMSQATASQLSGELQTLANALPLNGA
jgi:eukaryotic-like serine/threonine-protein kinase